MVVLVMIEAMIVYITLVAVRKYCTNVRSGFLVLLVLNLPNEGLKDDHYT